MLTAQDLIRETQKQYYTYTDEDMVNYMTLHKVESVARDMGCYSRDDFKAQAAEAHRILVDEAAKRLKPAKPEPRNLQTAVRIAIEMGEIAKEVERGEIEIKEAEAMLRTIASDLSSLKRVIWYKKHPGELYYAPKGEQERHTYTTSGS